MAFSITKFMKEKQEIPSVVRNRMTWAYRRALLPQRAVHCWIKTIYNQRFYLGDDPIDDLILGHVLERFTGLYYPKTGFDDEDFILLDVGAHHGHYGVEALRRYPNAHLVAVEPHPSALEYLQRQFDGNGLNDRVEIHNVGIAGNSGPAQLHVAPQGSWGDSLWPVDGAETVETKTVTMDRILNGRCPKLVKCNAEGAEFELFPQMFQADMFPDWVILMAHPEHGSVEDLLDLFREHGYTIADAGSTSRRIRLHCILDDAANR